ncbi:MAG: cation transporting ATPase C-terminal domain-containing protein, partial [Muribaculaceae bacterium]|nr:cation transporting ATPase C-terminal domain-containing protein [Muribaculaceae bacterium]
PLTSLTQFMRLPVGPNTGFTAHELSLFFSVFVFLQFWNIFNARAFATDRSAFHFGGCGGFITIAAIIVIGQILIVSFGEQAFSVVPLKIDDWLIIVCATFPVLLIGEIYRLIRYRHV